MTYHLFKNHDKLKYKAVFEETKSKKKQKSFNCPECEKKLSSSLARHMRLKHSIFTWVPDIPIYLTTKVCLPKLKKIKKKPSWPKMVAYTLQEICPEKKGTSFEVAEALGSIFTHLGNSENEKKRLLALVKAALTRHRYFVKTEELKNGKIIYPYRVHYGHWKTSKQRK